MKRNALQRQTSKRPHKPSSMIRGARTLGEDTENIEFHKHKMFIENGRQSPGTSYKYGRSRWWYHRNMYWKVSGQADKVYW